MAFEISGLFWPLITLIAVLRKSFFVEVQYIAQSFFVCFCFYCFEEGKHYKLRVKQV